MTKDREQQMLKASQLYPKHQQKVFVDGALWADRHPINDCFEKLKALPCEVIKTSGRLTGNYALRISISGGTWFLEYVYDGELFSGYEEAVYPSLHCSGDTIEDVINKAYKFFEDNFGQYELVKY